jgi:hypothetical protein
VGEFRCGFRARIVAVTLLGVAEKDVERLFGREVVVFGFVEVPDFGPVVCGVFCHVKSIVEMGLKVKRLFLKFRKFFAELTQVIEQRGCLIVQTGVEQVL